MTDSPELRQFLADQDLEDYCYINHIAVNYRGSDRPGNGRLSKWLRQLSFLEEFQDGAGQSCVRLRKAQTGKERRRRLIGPRRPRRLLAPYRRRRWKPLLFAPCRPWRPQAPCHRRVSILGRRRPRESGLRLQCGRHSAQAAGPRKRSPTVAERGA